MVSLDLNMDSDYPEKANKKEDQTEAVNKNQTDFAADLKEDPFRNKLPWNRHSPLADDDEADDLVHTNLKMDDLEDDWYSPLADDDEADDFIANSKQRH